MERCTNCGEPIIDEPIELGDDLFCSEECMDEYEPDDSDDDAYSDRYYGDDSSYADY